MRSVAELAAALLPFAPAGASQVLERIGRLLQRNGVPSSGNNGPISELPLSSNPPALLDGAPAQPSAGPTDLAPLAPQPAQSSSDLTDTGKPATQRSPTHPGSATVTGGTSRGWADPQTPSPTGSLLLPASQSPAFFVGIGIAIAFTLGGGAAFVLFGPGHARAAVVAPAVASALTTATAVAAVAPPPTITAVVPPAIEPSALPASSTAAPASAPPATALAPRSPSTGKLPSKTTPTSPPPQPTPPTPPAGDPFGAGRQ